nr:MAG TPA: hypothetical protein [Caudoviricetes sp.]
MDYPHISVLMLIQYLSQDTYLTIFANSRP